MLSGKLSEFRTPIEDSVIEFVEDRFYMDYWYGYLIKMRDLERGVAYYDDTDELALERVLLA